MNAPTDQQLLRDYAESHSEVAFGELVRRHLDLVYSAALRMVHDSHQAKDVTQGVFVALAQNAGQLTQHPVLSGWLHRTTQNLAANAVRANVRRQAREQEAAVMNKLLSAEPDTAWEEIAPQLDAALGELSEPDRDALLLRYFQHQSAREMAEILGVSVEAAQKRVNRAVERLREGFARRGIAMGASGVVLLSAHAVHAAPAGLAVTVSTTVALAGTAIPAATTLALKTAAMTTLQKTLVTVTVVALTGISLFEARQAAQLREGNQLLQQQQVSLTAQLQQSRRAQEESTNRQAVMIGEIAQLKSGQNQNELLKLRGQVGSLRQELATTQAKLNGTSFSLEKMMADPGMKELMNQQAWREIKLRFAELFQELKLSPDQIEQFARAYANSGLQDSATQEERKHQLHDLLGEAGLARLDEFTHEVPARATVRLLASQLGDNQLTEEQNLHLWKAVKGEPFELMNGIEGDLNMGLQGSPDEIEGFVRRIKESNQHIVQQAGEFLSPVQLTTLSTVLSNSLNTRIVQAAALVPGR